jgi:hypothetical protein
VASGCAYIGQWYSTNEGTWSSIESDITAFQADAQNQDIPSMETDSGQFQTDINLLTPIDQTQIPAGTNAPSNFADNIALFERQMTPGLQAYQSGNFEGGTPYIEAAVAAAGEAGIARKQCGVG